VVLARECDFVWHLREADGGQAGERVAAYQVSAGTSGVVFLSYVMLPGGVRTPRASFAARLTRLQLVERAAERHCAEGAQRVTDLVQSKTKHGSPLSLRRFPWRFPVVRLDLVGCQFEADGRRGGENVAGVAECVAEHQVCRPSSVMPLLYVQQQAPAMRKRRT
jgi:hypothetical protein